jgi:hypothetical protein
VRFQEKRSSPLSKIDSVVFMASEAVFMGSEEESAASDGLGADSEHDAASANDDSVDEDWEGEAESLSSEDLDNAVMISVASSSLSEQVAALVLADACSDKCLNGRQRELEQFLASVARLSKSERRVSIMTALSVLQVADTAERRRGHGLRKKYAYYLPLVGRVCRDVFCQSYSVAPATIGRYRAAIDGGVFAPKQLGNKGNKHAEAVDVSWVTQWFKAFASRVGDVVPVKVRRQTTQDRKVVRYYSDADYTLLPAYFTWERLHEEMQNCVADEGLDVYEPALSTMRKLLAHHCPRIRIRSPRSNVCDLCTIYAGQLKRGATAEATEEFGNHTAAARRMRCGGC